MQKFIPHFLVLLIYKGCVPSPVTLAKNNPATLIANADSLLAGRPDDPELRSAIVTAHLNLAKTNNNMDEYKAALKLDAKNATANYYIHMSEGKMHHEKGYKNGQWDAIQSFSKAAAAIDTMGEPYYWMGLAYEKKDEMDFELPLESYDKALMLHLPENIRLKVEAARGSLLDRKKTYKNFWK
ncbi:MAG: hypothetical protein U9N31_09580 [Candidatus Marinimicrobia bacterium]|nr:hypothetical protein [Candidatus Neomarinimicrobiota bacterium]